MNAAAQAEEAGSVTDRPPAAAGTAAGADESVAGGADESSEEITERLAGIFSGALTANLVCLGDRLGLYAALKEHGPCTAAALAERTAMQERYLSEWLRQQASARVISTDGDVEQFWLSPAQQDCLVHEVGEDASPFFFTGMFTALPGLARIADDRLPQLFREGGGISYNEVDHSVTCGVCRELAVWVRHALVPSLRALPGVEAALEAGCLVADVGCGMGKALMAVAQAFPASTCHGYDISEDALKAARAEAERRGLANCTFFNAGLDEEQLPAEATYRLVMTHDAIHDMAHPSAVLRAVQKATLPGGCWIIGDMASLESHAANVRSHPLAALLYGFSVHLCLPSGLSAPDGEGLGTLGLPAEGMCRMLRDAGFASAEVLEEFKHPLNRYYIATA